MRRSWTARNRASWSYISRVEIDKRIREGNERMIELSLYAEEKLKSV
jgi:hypothetical protein